MAPSSGERPWQRVAVELDRLQTAARVLRNTGLGRALRWPGLREVASALARGGRTSPASALRLHAKNSPERVALVAGGASFRYGELDALVDRVGASLRRRGVERGDAVAVMLKNRPEFLVAQYALGRVGASAVNVSWRSTPDELGHVLDDSGARWLFADEASRASAEAASARLGAGRVVLVGGEAGRFVAFDELADGPAGGAPDDPEGGAIIMYTSGTTGRPKGAVRTFQRDAFTQTLRFIDAAPFDHDDVHYAVCPLYHATAYGFVGLTFLLGARVVLGDEFAPASFDDAVRRHGVTHTAIVPTMLYRLVEAARRGEVAAPPPRTLRAVFVGGAPLTPALSSAALGAFGDILYQFYGSTETGIVTFAAPGDMREAPGTIGRALRGNDVRLLDAAGGPVAEGEVGELYVKNPWTFDAYHNNETATSAGRRGGYFSVGDLARRDAEGRYFLAGRGRELIISGGVNVYPAEVEAALADHPDVADAAVVGVPDEEWGERVRAYVVAREGRSPGAAELVAHCRERVAGPKVPRDVVFVEALPRNPTGKVLKGALGR